jgi:hypothetical protein
MLTSDPRCLTVLAMKKQGGQAREKLKLVSTRVPPEMVQRIEEFAERLNRERPGLLAERSVAMRVLLSKALDAMAEGKWA